MKVDEVFNGLWGELKGDFIRQDQVDMHDICLDVKELISEERVYNRILILLNLGFGRPLHQQRAQCPDCII